MESDKESLGERWTCKVGARSFPLLPFLLTQYSQNANWKTAYPLRSLPISAP